jgi:short-subunit dehydrogenase
MTIIDDRLVLITGAAAGLGREMAFAFGARGARLALLDRDGETLDRTVRDLERQAFRVQAYPCDVTCSPVLETVVAAVEREGGPVEILVNNAGIAVGKPILEAGMDEIRRVIEVNLLALMDLTKRILPAMTRRNRGHIVNIASAAGLLAMPRLAPYCASKFAVVGFSDALRQEMKKYGCNGVKVTCVCPSVISTGMFDGFRPPRLNPLLAPEAVARRVVRAVAADRDYVKMPFMVHLIPLFRLLPAGLMDRIGAILGTARAMDAFRGHRQQ